MVSSATALPFTSIMLSVNAEAPVHRDSYNSGQNTIVPVVLPRHGGNLWIELQRGDTITGTVEVRSANGKSYAGQILDLKVGEACSFDPKRRHATQPWTSGQRILLAAYCSGSHWKATSEVQGALSDLGFRLPLGEVAGSDNATMSEQPKALREAIVILKALPRRHA